MRATLSVWCELRGCSVLGSAPVQLTPNWLLELSVLGSWVGSRGFRPAYPKLSAALRRGSDSPPETTGFGPKEAHNARFLGRRPGFPSNSPQTGPADQRHIHPLAVVIGAVARYGMEAF